MEENAARLLLPRDPQQHQKDQRAQNEEANGPDEAENTFLQGYEQSSVFLHRPWIRQQAVQEVLTKT